MSAAMKRVPEPAAFPSAERAALGHAIARAADVAARRAGLEQASQAADRAVLAAIGAVEAAEAALEEAKGNTAKHAVDRVLGTAGPPPMTVGQARAAVIKAQDHLDECRDTRAALKSELDRGDNGLSALLVTDAARAVIRVEMQQRAIALAAEVTRLQSDLVSKGSALQWLSGVLPRADLGQDDPIRRAVERMESAPTAWMIGTIRGGASFAIPTGGNAWAAAFESMLRDANAQLPKDFG